LARHFALADHLLTTGLIYEHGLLHANLANEMPEAPKLRWIEIAFTALSAAQVHQAQALVIAN
jgi:hypothetical protein